MRRRIKYTFIIYILFFFITSCFKNNYETRTFYALGTVVQITLPENEEGFVTANRTIISLENEIKNFYKKFDKLSKGGSLKFSPLIGELFNDASFYYEISNKRFDVTIATLTKLYGFPEGPFKVPDEKEVANAIKNMGFQNLKITDKSVIKLTDVSIDFGAFAKGYIVDETIKKLKKLGVSSGIVDAGGDLYAFGMKDGRKWKIAIKDPDKEGFLSIVSVSEKAVVTSGNYERYFIDKNGNRVIHIFDATTKKSANNYKSVSVIADTAERADGLSTVYFLLTIPEIKKLCIKFKTPVLIYTLENKLLKLCNWQLYED